MKTYRIVRRYALGIEPEIIKTGQTLEEAQEHCKDPETSSRTAKRFINTERTRRLGQWFDGYEEES